VNRTETVRSIKAQKNNR